MRVEEKKQYVLKFVLLNLVLLFIVQPGSIGYANFDAPYGFMVDLTAWLSSFVGVSPVAFMYLYRKRAMIDGRMFYAYGAFITGLALLTYYVQQPLFEGFRSPGYTPGFPLFLLGSLLGAVLSLGLLPFSILKLNQIYLGYGYDLPLGIANLVILTLIIALSLKLRHK
jgi:hypothetical protein